MEQWEYSVGTWNNMHLAKIDEIREFLNKNYGVNGWELVSAAVFPEVEAEQQFQGASAPIRTSFYTVMIFKRPKQSR